MKLIQMEDSLWYRKLSLFQDAMGPLSQWMEEDSPVSYSPLQQQGLIRYFHFAHQAAIDVLLSYLHRQGKDFIRTGPDATREAANMGLISGQKKWIKMIDSKARLANTIDPVICAEMVKLIQQDFHPSLSQFLAKMKSLRKGEKGGLF